MEGENKFEILRGERGRNEKEMVAYKKEAEQSMKNIKTYKYEKGEEDEKIKEEIFQMWFGR